MWTLQTGKQQISGRVIMDDKNQSEQFQSISDEPHSRHNVTATHREQEADEMRFKCVWCLHCDPAFFLSSRDRRLASNTKQSHHRPTRQKRQVGDGAAGGGRGRRTLITTVAKGRKANELSRRSGVVSACLPARHSSSTELTTLALI